MAAAVFAQDLGAGSVDSNGKPVFLATEHTKYVPTTERSLTDQEQLRWKSFQLYRTTVSLERRDMVYSAHTNSDFTNFRLSNHILGTPFPVIDQSPSLWDTFYGIRWYEHLICFSSGALYRYWLMSKPSLRCQNMRSASKENTFFVNFLCLEVCFAYRSMWRLRGEVPNDPECRYYGVLEDSTRLKQKAEIWSKYAAYKEEWCKRWDYHVYGIRPGERFSLFSACMLPPFPVRYNTKFDYPARKNPYFLSTTPLRDMFLENSFIENIPRGETNYPLAQARPEVAFTYHGPDQTPSTRK